MQGIVITDFVEDDARKSPRSWFRVYAEKTGRPIVVVVKSNAPVMACVRCGCLTSICIIFSGSPKFQVGQRAAWSNVNASTGVRKVQYTDKSHENMLLVSGGVRTRHVLEDLIMKTR